MPTINADVMNVNLGFIEPNIEVYYNVNVLTFETISVDSANPSVGSHKTISSSTINIPVVFLEPTTEVDYNITKDPIETITLDFNNPSIKIHKNVTVTPMSISVNFQNVEITTEFLTSKESFLKPSKNISFSKEQITKTFTKSSRNYTFYAG